MFWPLTAIAQYEHLLNKTYAQRAEAIKQIYLQALSAPGAAQANKVIDAFASFARQSKEEELMLEARLLKTFYLSRHVHDRQEVLAGYEALITDARQQGVAQIAARSLEVLAGYYWAQVVNYELAFEKYIELSQLLATLPDQDYPDKMASLRSIGAAHYYFAGYTEAIRYLKQAAAITLTDFNRRLYVDILNTIGLSYQKLGDLDSADYYFRTIIESRDLPADAVWQNIARGNLGYSYFLRGQYEEAIPLLEADVVSAVQIEDWGLASGSIMPLATIYLQRGQVEKAAMLARQATAYVRRSGQYERYQQLYPLLAKLYAAKGEPLPAALFVDSAIYVRDSLVRQFNTLQLLRAHQRVERQQQKALQENLAFEKKLKLIERNTLLAILLLLMAVLVYVYTATRRKMQQEQVLKKLQLREKEKELARAAEQLHEFAQNIQEKNRLIDNLESRFAAGSNQTILQELRQSTILTDEDWDRFRTHFEQVHVGFLDRLRQKIPNLTPAETRFMVLAKLGFSNKEMAAALGVSAQNVRTIWYRIRKKYSLPEEAGQEDLAGLI